METESPISFRSSSSVALSSDSMAFFVLRHQRDFSQTKYIDELNESNKCETYFIQSINNERTFATYKK